MQFLKLEKTTTWVLSLAGLGLAALYLVNNQYGVEFQKIVSVVLGLVVAVVLLLESNYKLTIGAKTEAWRKVVGSAGLVVGIALLVGFFANLLTLNQYVSWLQPFQTVIGWASLVLFVLLALID